MMNHSGHIMSSTFCQASGEGNTSLFYPTAIDQVTVLSTHSSSTCCLFNIYNRVTVNENLKNNI